MYGVEYSKELDNSRVFFIDILARRLLFWGCIDMFEELYPQDMGIYAELLALRKQIVIDKWEGIAFGNIDENNMKALTIDDQNDLYN